VSWSRALIARDTARAPPHQTRWSAFNSASSPDFMVSRHGSLSRRGICLFADKLAASGRVWQRSCPTAAGRDERPWSRVCAGCRRAAL